MVIQAWVGPAIVAAFISGLVSLIVVQLNFRQERRIEQLRREEKVRDFQIALQAAITSDLLNLKVANRVEFLAHVTAAYKADPGYSPIVPRLASNFIFGTVLEEIHILPGEVIAPVVHYARLRQTLERFVDDIRADSFKQLKAERQLLMYTDYLAMSDRLQELANMRARPSIFRLTSVTRPRSRRAKNRLRGRTGLRSLRHDPVSSQPSEHIAVAANFQCQCRQTGMNGY